MYPGKYLAISASVLLLFSFSAYGFKRSYDTQRQYGFDTRPYGAQQVYGIHPGIDFMVGAGTPVIAAADGKVLFTKDGTGPQPWQNGFTIKISHGDIDAVYVHLVKVHVSAGQTVRRGQVIGLSGSTKAGGSHLHFGIVRKGGYHINFSDTYDPDLFWVAGAQKCFQPGKVYSSDSKRNLTLPLRCG